MKTIEFPEHNFTIGKDQPEYNQIPAYRENGDQYGRAVFCWELSWKERLSVLFKGLIWHEVLTFNKPLQPQKLSIGKPEMEKFAAIYGK